MDPTALTSQDISPPLAPSPRPRVAPHLVAGLRGGLGTGRPYGEGRSTSDCSSTGERPQRLPDPVGSISQSLFGAGPGSAPPGEVQPHHTELS